jgi:hypothetical protein
LLAGKWDISSHGADLGMGTARKSQVRLGLAYVFSIEPFRPDKISKMGIFRSSSNDFFLLFSPINELIAPSIY